MSVLFLKIIVIILLADFATGMFHFYVDQYAQMNPKYFAAPINGLLIHHEFPLKMVEQSYWHLTKGVYIVGGSIFMLSLSIGFSWELLLLVGISAQANLIHKWSHQEPSQRPKVALLLQKYFIIQDDIHHLRHHNGKYDQYYCVMTLFCNPLLEKIKFWTGVIRVLSLFGIKPKHKMKS